jgi:hypothetical protein
VSTKFLDRLAFGNDCDDEASNGDWTDLGWTVVAAPQPLVAGVGIADATAQFWGAPGQHPAPTPVIGHGQTETAGVCDYPTVIRTRTRTRPAR